MTYYDRTTLIPLLSDEQAGRLFKAMRAYSMPEDGSIPDFSDDPMLNSIWAGIQSALDEDDARYLDVRTKRKYGAYCGACKDHAVRPMNRLDWETAGCPTYLDMCQQEQHVLAHANTCEPETEPNTEPYSEAETKPESESETKTETGPPPAAPMELDSPYLKSAFMSWLKHCEELKRPLTPTARNILLGQVLKMSRRYSPVAVELLIQECIAQGQKHIYFDRLEKNPSGYDLWWDRPLELPPDDELEYEEMP